MFVLSMILDLQIFPCSSACAVNYFFYLFILQDFNLLLTLLLIVRFVRSEFGDYFGIAVAGKDRPVTFVSLVREIRSCVWYTVDHSTWQSAHCENLNFSNSCM